METIKQEYAKYKIEQYEGSLDYDCDFCGKNSYNNIHISKDQTLIVICRECLKKAIRKKNKKNKRKTKMSENEKFEEVVVIIKKGDILTSKKSFLSKSPLTGKFYTHKKMEYLGDGNWFILDDKKEIEVKKL